MSLIKPSWFLCGHYMVYAALLLPEQDEFEMHPIQSFIFLNK
jgi:hypothetical protein